MLQSLIEPLITIHKYAAATVAHWIICGVAGAMTVHSRIRGGAEARMIASHVIIFWLCYEITEFAHEHDNVEADIANGLFGYVCGALIAHYGYKLRVWYRKRKKEAKKDV